MKKLKKTICFLFLGLISLHDMLVAMKREDIDDEVMEEFKKLNLNNNNTIQEKDRQDIHDQEAEIDSSSVFDSQTTPLLPPQRSSSTPFKLNEKIKLKPKFHSEEPQLRKRNFKIAPTLRTLLLRSKIGQNDYKEYRLQKDVMFFNEAKILLLEGIKKGLSCKIESAIKLCPENMLSELLSQPLGKKNLHLSPGSLIIGLHGKNLKKCKLMLMVLLMNDASELDGCTFLHTAAFFNCSELIVYLLTEGLVNAFTLGGEDEKVSALHYALKHKCFDAAYALMRVYNNNKKMLSEIINQRDSLSRTPLHYLVDQSFDEYFPVELEYDEKHDSIEPVNCPGNYQQEKIKMITFLCEVGANVEVHDSMGLTPIDYAKKYNDKTVFEMLQKYVSKKNISKKILNFKK